MTKTIDYYDYWNEKRVKNEKLLHREIISIGMVSSIINKQTKIIDLGCGHGKFMMEIKKRFNPDKLKGIDYSKKEIEEARRYGLDVNWGNFEEKINEKNESYNVAYAAELIEHLYNPDLFLAETNRILKMGGYLIISTPNLLAWFNRILVPLGIQPLFIEPSTKSKLVGAGILKSLKKDSQPVGHIRIFSYDAIKDILNNNGFRVIKIAGAIYDEGLPKSLWGIDKLISKIPSLGSHFVVLAKKVDSPRY